MSTLSNIKKIMKAEKFNPNKGGSAITYFLKRHSEFCLFLDKFLALFPCFEKYSEVLSWLQNDLKIAKCLNCKKRLTYTQSRKGVISCSKECTKSKICREHKNDARLAKMIVNGTNMVNPFAREDIKQKIKATNLLRYGVQNPMQNKKIAAKSSANLMKYNLTERNLKRGYNVLSQKTAQTFTLELLTDFENYSGITNGTIYKFRCKVCNTEFDYKWNNSKNLKYACPHCHPYYRSRGEEEIANFIKSLNVDALLNDRILLKDAVNSELDVYIPSRNLAIEFNGLYWHSEAQGKDRYYHLDKTIACAEQGTQLIHIFEDEWENKQQIVKARLRHLLRATKYKIQARKCEIKEVANIVSSKFLNKYHLQGAINAPINLGLFYRNRLVALMSFGKPRFNKNYKYELLRYCTIANFSILGGAGKLLNYFIRRYDGSIISYADRRWSNGGLYKKIGFKELKPSQPAYFYVNEDGRHNRVKFQKHKLQDKLNNYDPNLSESENMYQNGYNRIWDCGNLVFALDN